MCDWIRVGCILIAVGFAVVFGGGSATRATADDAPGGDEAPTLGERVNRAIDEGVEWLTSAQQKDGSWGPCVNNGFTYDGTPIADPRCYTTGPTSFALFTLAKCGVSRKDPVMKKGLKWVRGRLKKGLAVGRVDGRQYVSYESASAILMLSAVYDTGEPMKLARKPSSKPKGSAFSKSDWRLLHKCMLHLIGDGEPSTGCQTLGGGWGYYPNHVGGGDPDVSATQFALLALRAAIRVGYPVDKLRPDVWELALSYLKTVQKKSGAFGYKETGGWTNGMTAAGLASLLICREQIRRAGGEPLDWVDERIDRALGHLGKFLATNNVVEHGHPPTQYQYCYLYAIERVGSLARRHLIGKKDWYRTGAEYLLTKQSPTIISDSDRATRGAWNDPTSMGPTLELGTCFALLFLKRATPPPATTGR